jgi:hypothetical protein
VARPPVATGRLSKLADGRLHYQLKRRWRDGTTAILFTPDELIEKLAALVPPPRIHTVRYHGVLGPRAMKRRAIVPASWAAAATGDTHAARKGRPHAKRSVDGSATRTEEGPQDGDQRHVRPRRLSWAELMRRVFSFDVLECARCGGRMRVIAAIRTPEPIGAILECMGLSVRAPPVSASATRRSHPEAESLGSWDGSYPS